VAGRPDLSKKDQRSMPSAKSPPALEKETINTQVDHPERLSAVEW